MLGSKTFGARSVDLWPTEHISNWRLQSNEVVYFSSQTFVVLVTSQDKVASIPHPFRGRITGFSQMEEPYTRDMPLQELPVGQLSKM